MMPQIEEITDTSQIRQLLENVQRSPKRDNLKTLLKRIISDCRASMVQLNHLGFGEKLLVQKFHAARTKFSAYVAALPHAAAYLKVVNGIDEVLGKHFNFPQPYDIPSQAFVDPDAMDLTVVGNMIWNYVHHAPALLLLALQQGKIKHFYNFPTLVYNVDNILECPRCHADYVELKNNDPEILKIIKKIAFGDVLNGVRLFHNHITRNIRERRGDGPGNPFNILDYMLTYGYWAFYDGALPPNYSVDSYIEKQLIFLDRGVVQLCYLLEYRNVGRPFVLQERIRDLSYVLLNSRPEDDEKVIEVLWQKLNNYASAEIRKGDLESQYLVKAFMDFESAYPGAIETLLDADQA